MRRRDTRPNGRSYEMIAGEGPQQAENVGPTKIDAIDGLWVAVGQPWEIEREIRRPRDLSDPLRRAANPRRTRRHGRSAALLCQNRRRCESLRARSSVCPWWLKSSLAVVGHAAEIRSQVFEQFNRRGSRFCRLTEIREGTSRMKRCS